jgi:hypothetical protein
MDLTAGVRFPFGVLCSPSLLPNNIVAESHEVKLPNCEADGSSQSRLRLQMYGALTARPLAP